MNTGRTPRTVAAEKATRRAPGASISRRRIGSARPRQYAPGHSRFVAMMKLLLPMTAVALITLVVAWPHFKINDERFRIGFTALKAREAENPSMMNARYLGIDDRDRAYSISADMAKSQVGKGDVVELEMPKADITLQDGTWLVLTAETGVYTRETKTLKLTGAVNLFHDSGYEIRTSSADIDLSQSVAVGDKPVEGHGPFGELKAEGFHFVDSGKVITFSGKAKLVFFPGIGKPSS